MGYTALLFLPSILLSPVILCGAIAVWAIALRLRLTPAGVPGVISFALTVCMAYGAFFLVVSADMLILRPARLQKAYLGEVYGDPLSLRFFDQSGFQDPNSEWRYALSAEDAAALSKRCKPAAANGQFDGCTLFSGMDHRWVASVTLRGRELTVSDGLW